MVSVNICREEGWYQQHRSSSRRVVLRVRRFLETLVLHFAMQSGDAYRVRGKAPLMPFEVKHFSYLTDTSRYGFDKKRVRIYITHYIHTTIIQCKLEAIDHSRAWATSSSLTARCSLPVNIKIATVVITESVITTVAILIVYVALWPMMHNGRHRRDQSRSNYLSSVHTALNSRSFV